MYFWKGGFWLDTLLAKAEVFNDYIKELANWIRQEGDDFIYTERLPECGEGVRDAICDAKNHPDRLQEDFSEATRLLDEFRSIMNLLVVYGILTEIQSRPLLSACGEIKDNISVEKKGR